MSQNDCFDIISNYKQWICISPKIFKQRYFFTLYWTKKIYGYFKSIINEKYLVFRGPILVVPLQYHTFLMTNMTWKYLCLQYGTYRGSSLMGRNFTFQRNVLYLMHQVKTHFETIFFFYFFVWLLQGLALVKVYCAKICRGWMNTFSKASHMLIWIFHCIKHVY